VPSRTDISVECSDHIVQVRILYRLVVLPTVYSFDIRLCRADRLWIENRHQFTRILVEVNATIEFRTFGNRKLLMRDVALDLRGRLQLDAYGAN